MICFRCEHRARCLSDRAAKASHVRRPRFECGVTEQSVSSCYMWQPCALPVFERNPNDPRPVTLGYFGARVFSDSLVPREQVKLVSYPYGAKRDKRFIVLPEIKTKEDLKADKARAKVELKARVAWERGFKRESHKRVRTA